jgi:hypothetical protein
MNAMSDAIRNGWDAARPDDPEPTVRYFRDLLERHPAEAVARLIMLALDRAGDADLQHYQRALRQYAKELMG